jgi:hypothetical protein
MNRAWRYNQTANTYWADRKVHRWSPDARLLGIYLLTCPDRVAEGFHSLPLVLVLDHLGWDRDQFDAAMSELHGAEFATYSYEAEAVFVVRALKYTPPKGISSIRGALSMLQNVDGAPELFDRFLAAADKYAPEFAAAIKDRYGLAREAPLRGATPVVSD